MTLSIFRLFCKKQYLIVEKIVASQLLRLNPFLRHHP